MVFLLRHETQAGEQTAFYDFVPYKYGPFSFTLYHELGSLETSGHVSLDSASISLSSELRGEVRVNTASLPSSLKSAVVSVVERYGSMDRDALLRDVYSKYPWFAVNSELDGVLAGAGMELPQAPLAVYTVGYEGKSVDVFFDGLLREGIACIADVRKTPVSRKYGFARSRLEETAGRLGMEYRHFPCLGVPREYRKDLGSCESYQRLWDVYDRVVLVEQSEAVDQLSERVKVTPTAIMCMEADPMCCHRSRLAAEVGRRTKMEVVSLS